MTLLLEHGFMRSAGSVLTKHMQERGHRPVVLHLNKGHGYIKALCTQCLAWGQIWYLESAGVLYKSPIGEATTTECPEAELR
jgi:hypothetical protein